MKNDKQIKITIPCPELSGLGMNSIVIVGILNFSPKAKNSFSITQKQCHSEWRET